MRIEETKEEISNDSLKWFQASFQPANIGFRLLFHSANVTDIFFFTNHLFYDNLFEKLQVVDYT